MNDINKRTGEHMRRIRKKKRLTIEEVSNLMGYKSKNTLSRIELGAKQITVEDVQKFADAVGMSFMEFFGGMTNL